MGAVEHLKKSCCRGLKPESAMIAVSPVLHDILPHGWSRMVLLEPGAAMGPGFAENPAVVEHFRERLWHFMDDKSSPMSLWTAAFHANAIGGTLNFQGRNWLESRWYREMESPGAPWRDTPKRG